MAAYRLPEVVDFDNFLAVRAEGEAGIDAQDEPEMDLGNLQSASFVVVALLVGWFRYAHGRGKVVKFTHVSPGVMNIVEVSELGDLLTLEAVT